MQSGSSLKHKYSRVSLGVHPASPLQNVNSMRQYIGGVIAERNILSPRCLFVMTLSNNWAEEGGNRYRFLHKNDIFKLKKTLDRHSPRLKLNYSLLPNPPHFSLLSTFKLLYLFYEHVFKTFCFMELGYL